MELTNDYISRVMCTLSGRYCSSKRPTENLEYLFEKLVDKPFGIDFAKVALIINCELPVFFTGSRTINGAYSCKSDLDLIVAINKEYYDSLKKRTIDIGQDAQCMSLEDCGKANGYEDEAETSPFVTFRFGIINLIMVTSEDYHKWKLVTQVAISLNLKDRRDRIVLFKAIRNGIIVDKFSFSQRKESGIKYSSDEEWILL